MHFTYPFTQVHAAHSAIYVYKQEAAESDSPDADRRDAGHETEAVQERSAADGLSEERGHEGEALEDIDGKNWYRNVLLF